MDFFMSMLRWTVKVYLCLKISFLMMQLLFLVIREMKRLDVSFYLVTFMAFILGQTTLSGNITLLL